MQILKKMPTLLNMPKLKVTDEYIKGFFKADNTFLYQLIFDPRTRQIRPLLQYPSHKSSKDFHYCGPYPSFQYIIFTRYIPLLLGSNTHLSV